jgi:hypothetical protein
VPGLAVATLHFRLKENSQTVTYRVLDEDTMAVSIVEVRPLHLEYWDGNDRMVMDIRSGGIHFYVDGLYVLSDHCTYRVPMRTPWPSPSSRSVSLTGMRMIPDTSSLSRDW